MAIVTSSFQNQAQINAVVGTIDAAMDNFSAWFAGISQRQYDLQNATTNRTDTQITVSIPNGDLITVLGSGLTTQTPTITSLNYHFVDGANVVATGAVTVSQGALTGGINQIVFSTGTAGTVTFNGSISLTSLNLSSLHIDVSSIVWDVNGAHFELTGSLAADMQSGTFDSLTLSANSMTFHANNLAYVIDANTDFNLDSAGDLTESLLGGNDTVTGTGASAILYGYDGSDTLIGTAGIDLLIGGAGNDIINGGAGIDTAQFSGMRSSYSLNPTTGGYTCSGGTDGTDTLTNIERIEFANMNLALDVTAAGNAGRTMEFIGTVAPGFLNDLTIRGSILSLFDQGFSMLQLSNLALQYNLLPHGTNAQLANQVYQNVLGSNPTQDMTNALVGYINVYGQADFVATVAGLALNVNLVGLQQTGLQYYEYPG